MRDRLLELEIVAGAQRRAGLEEALRRSIRSGRLSPGSLLPSTRALADDMGLARSTVVAAYEQLIAEGYLVARQGAGTVVAGTGAIEPASPQPGIVERLGLEFVPGEPDRSAFPRRAWLAAVTKVMAQSPDELFGYGDPGGRPELRQALSQYLARTRALVTEPERMSIFSGFISALLFVVEALSEDGIDRIAVEDPTMPMLRTALASTGVAVVPIPVDAEGVNVDTLEASGVRTVIVTPAHQYPLGVSMTPTRRAALVDWSRRTSSWIVEDDYDGEFRYDRQPIGALQGLAADRVIYAGTASKSLAAGLRIAWLVVPAELVEPVARAKGRLGGVSGLEQAVFASFVEAGALDRHVAMRRRVYRTRQAQLRGALDDAVPTIALAGVSAGLHLTAYLPGPSNEAEVIAHAARHGMALSGLSRHFAAPDGRAGLVLGFSRASDQTFPRTVLRLAETLREALHL